MARSSHVAVASKTMLSRRVTYASGTPCSDVSIFYVTVDWLGQHTTDFLPLFPTDERMRLQVDDWTRVSIDLLERSIWI